MTDDGDLYRNRCSYQIEGPLAQVGPGRERPWWRRLCKRQARPGTDRRWQHQRPGDTP